MTRRGLLILLSSPSGAGKSTLTRLLREWDPSILFSVSATTRAPRPGEEHGREYFFVGHDDFGAMVDDNRMLEHAEVFGNFYGTPAGPVEEAIRAGQDMLFDLDWQGGQQLRASSLGKHVLSIFFLPPSISALEGRLRTRAQDSDDVIADRMKKSRDEISHWSEYDYVLVNDDLAATAERLKTIVTAERLRLSQQPDLTGFVRGLNAEYDELQP
ncbi:MAG: guanylate kinase [Paracoccaceae bacterium]